MGESERETVQWPAFDDPRCWPNDQRYLGNCRECSRQFFGPKRAPCCYECWGKRPKAVDYAAGPDRTVFWSPDPAVREYLAQARRSTLLEAAEMAEAEAERLEKGALEAERNDMDVTAYGLHEQAKAACALAAAYRAKADEEATTSPASRSAS